VAVWPEVRRRVIGLVISRGTARDAAEDVAQEVAVRAVRATPSFRSADELFWWCSTVAKRYVIDEHRRNDRVTTVASTPDAIERDTPEATYERQQLVDAVLTQLAKLSESQRAAIARIDAPADYVRRHRARRLLLAVVESFAAAVGWLWWRARGTRRAVALGAGVVATALVVGGLSGWPVHLPRPASPPDRAGAVATTSVTTEAVRPATETGTSKTTATSSPPSFNLDRILVHGVATPTPAGPVTAGIRPGEPQPKLLCAWSAALHTSLCIDYPVRP